MSTTTCTCFEEKINALLEKRRSCNYFPPHFKTILFETADAVAYVWDDGIDSPCAMGFGGARRTFDFSYRFKSTERREEYIVQWASRLIASAQEKKARRKAKNDFNTSLVPGDVLSYSWGYDQTNVDWYQVIEVSKTGKSIVMRKIAGDTKETGFMCGESIPVKDSFIGEPKKKRVSVGDVVSMSCGIATKWSGSPKYVSWYG